LSADRKAVARELLRRLRCQQSIHSFYANIDVPRSPSPAMRPDEDLLGPARNLMPVHFAKILEVMQRTMDRPSGRAIIQAPPGSAKSTLADAVAVPWEMGRKPGSRLLLLSYASEVAERQSRLAQNVVQQAEYQAIWPESPKLMRDAAGEWNMSNGSELAALGILGSVTSRRASGIVIDDPVAGREEADSELQRARLLNAYQDDVLTRLLPNGWIIIIMTRWNEQDLAGSVLPEDYDGGSGMYTGRDGLQWEVLSLPAKCERTDDPLGRKTGEYIWPEWFPPEHWAKFEHAKGAEAQRTWSSLCQQRPTPQGNARLDEGAIDYYKPGTQPPILGMVGAGDYAVTAGKNDFTEQAVFGIDTKGDLWEMDWWHEQCDTGKSTEQMLDMVARWRVPMWFNEGGVIDKSMGPLMNMRMRERQVFTDRRALPSMQDKLAKCQAFIARCNAGTVHFRDSANSRRVIAQIASLPAGRYDDAADVCGLIGRALDQFPIVREYKPPPKIEPMKPFTKEWLEYRPARTDGVREY
jgi:phage terminase large subunit-like protein